MSAFASSLFAWLLTYLIHSTVLLGVAWLVTRPRRLEPAARELLWKVALVAGLVTGTIQSRLQRRTARRHARRAAAQHRIPAPRSPHDGPNHLESRGARSLGDLRARIGPFRTGRRAAAQHAGARAGPSGAARFPVARGRQPD